MAVRYKGNSTYKANQIKYLLYRVDHVVDDILTEVQRHHSYFNLSYLESLSFSKLYFHIS